MEDSKNNFVSFFQMPWVKALIAFIIFLLIFLAGAAFGSHFGGHRYAGQNGFMRFQTTTSRGGNVMFRGTERAIPANGSINIQSQGTHRMGQLPGGNVPSANGAQGQQGGSINSVTPPASGSTTQTQ